MPPRYQIYNTFRESGWVYEISTIRRLLVRITDEVRQGQYGSLKVWTQPFVIPAQMWTQPFVIPAQAGIQRHRDVCTILDSRLRGNDEGRRG